MIQENQKLFNRLNVISDAAVSFVAVVISYLFVFSLLGLDKNYPLIDYVKIALVFAPVQLITFGCLGLYDSHRTSGFSKELWKMVQAFFIDGLFVIAMLYIVKVIDFSRLALAIFLLLDFVIITLKRFVLRKTLKYFRKSGYNKKYVLVIGGGQTAAHYLNVIREESQMGFECAGYIAAGDSLDAKRLGGYDEIFNILDKTHYDEVVCALDTDEMEYLGEAVESCEFTGTKISVIPSIYKYMTASPAIDMVGGIPMMNIRRIPLDNMGNAFMKRAIDILGSLVLIILSSPVMLISAIVIKATMGGKVIFKQKRVGLNKKIFTMYKLKSMKDNADSDTAWSTENDPRKTRFGAFIRKFSIDELPQLFNVLKGDMSLVGPRPEIPFYVSSFKKTIPMYMIKHQVKPGMTGLAQVRGFRGDTSIEKRIQCDIEYIENWNIFLDISILFKTVLSGFVNKEKLKRSSKKYRPEKNQMSNEKQKIDYMALAVFFPSVIALAIVPIIMRATMVVSDLLDTYRYFNATESSETVGQYILPDINAQGKAFAVMFIAIAMLVIALIGCLYLFRRVEKRSLVYVGASVAYVIMSLASALGSDFQQIAFYGMHDRAEGFFTTACYFVMFLFTMYAFKKTQNFRYVVIALMISTGVNFIIGMFQYTGNNLLQYDWFMSFITEPAYRDMMEVNTESGSFGSMYGALYHYNYVGSFTGMVIPLFTVLAVTGKRIWHKIVFALFAGMSLFMLFASSARSGIIAIAAAFVVGVFIFARVLIRRWKITVSVVAGALVLVIGVNFAMNNALFDRIPSLVGDVVDFVLPAEETDLYDQLPVREIKHNPDGSVSFVTKTDELNIVFDTTKKDFVFTDKSGAAVPLRTDNWGYITADDDDFRDITFEIMASDDNPDHGDTIFMWFGENENEYFTFALFNEKQIHMIDRKLSDRITPINAEAIGFEGKEKLGSSRGYIWSRTIPLLKNCILTGYGPDTFVYVFPQNDYLAKYYAYNEEFNVVVDKPHNLYLQIAVSNGIVALIAFLVICVFYLVDCFRLYSLKKKYRAEQIYGISVMLAIVGYLAAGLFNDSVVAVAPVFWILLGTGVALNTINRRTDKAEANGEIYLEDEPAKEKKAFSDTQMQTYEDRAREINDKINAQREAERAEKARKIAAIKQANQKNAQVLAAAIQQNKAAKTIAEAALKKNDAQGGKRVITKEDKQALLDKIQKIKDKYEAEHGPIDAPAEKDSGNSDKANSN